MTTMLAELAPIAALFVLGFAGSPHCLGMCGGIGTALSARPGPNAWWTPHAGRLTTYALLGALGGSASGLLQLALTQGLLPLRILAAVLLLCAALQMVGVRTPLASLERRGFALFRRMPVSRMSGGIATGVAWGFLPCGLVYTALASSALLAHPAYGALGMLAFGAGTLPALLGAGVVTRKLARHARLRGVLAACVAALAVGSVLLLLDGGQHGHGAHPHTAR